MKKGRVARKAWPGGKIVSNKGQARVLLVARLKKRQENGWELNAQQRQLLEDYEQGKLHLEVAKDELPMSNLIDSSRDFESEEKSELDNVKAKSANHRTTQTKRKNYKTRNKSSKTIKVKALDTSKKKMKKHTAKPDITKRLEQGLSSSR